MTTVVAPYTREYFERLEEERLAIYASRSARAERPRGAVSSSPGDARTDYARDRDRIIHSRAFRRLKHKTQVFIPYEGDHFRTRLTHTIEVAQIARSVARSLGLNEDLTEAVALGHDLGHTPFGHSGEYVLDRLLRESHPEAGGFKHNYQSVRVVDRLEKRYEEPGLNLTHDVREGMLKHTAWPHDFPFPLDFVEGLRFGSGGTLEAQTVNWSDEMYSIYGVHPGEFRPSFESYLERIHPEDRARAAATVALALMDNRAFSMDERIVRPDGRVRQLRSHGEVVRDEGGRPLKMVGACIDVTEQKAAEAALRALTRRLVEAEETERRRIARELHDRVGQNLSALNINLDILLGQLRDEPARRRLEDSLKLVDATLQSIENVMADLRPALLDEYGLAAALAWYGEEYAQRTGIRVGVQAGEAGASLRPEAAVALFRIAQEALNNAAKHSSAKRITVGLEEEGGELVLRISDDGKGFDPASAPRGRWGMTTMRERAEATGGRLLVESSPGSGTTVSAAVPL